MKYAFFNSGTGYFFKPEKVVYDVRTNTKYRNVDFHIMLMKQANSPSCFVLDDKGAMITA